MIAVPEFITPQDGHNKQDCLVCNRISVEIADGQGKTTYRNGFAANL